MIMKPTNLSTKKYLILVSLILAALIALIIFAPRTSAQHGVITVDNPDTVAPVLSIVQNNERLSVVASDANLDASSWQRSGPFSVRPNCEATTIVYNQAHAANRHLTLTEADNSLWYCFKVADTDKNVGYARFQVLGVELMQEVAMPVEQPKEEPPVEEVALAVSAIQADNAITVTANKGLSDEAWASSEVLIVESATACHAASFQRLSRSVFMSTRVTSLSWRDNGRFYCFRVSEDAGASYAYASIQVSGLVAPVTTTNSPAPVAPASVAEPAADDETVAPDSNDAGAANNAEVAANDKEEADDDDDDETTLRSLGIGVVVAGVLAIIAVTLFGRRQSADAEDEEEL